VKDKAVDQLTVHSSDNVPPKFFLLQTHQNLGIVILQHVLLRVSTYTISSLYFRLLPFSTSLRIITQILSMENTHDNYDETAQPEKGLNGQAQIHHLPSTHGGSKRLFEALESDYIRSSRSSRSNNSNDIPVSIIRSQTSRKPLLCGA